MAMKLNELLEDSDDNNSVTTERYSKNVKDKYSKYRDNKGHALPEQKKLINSPPSLAQLEAQGGYKHNPVLRNVNTVTYDEQEQEDMKRELMFKLELLKKSYPHAVIPEFSIYTEYKSMKKSYDDTVRRLSLDSSVETYKKYLIGGFMLCEFLLGIFLKLDMQGFTQQQILSMNSYEKLLIELGEKSYISTSSKWPVELRLLGLIVINAGFFIVSKMIMKKTGANLLGMINNMNMPQQQYQNNSQQKKKKMKGPDIDIDNIPDN